MPEKPSDPTMERIRSTLRNLCGEQDLDADTSAELCNHLEEKTLGYLRGDVKLTEQDAILLACRHFGDLSRVAAALEREHRAPGRFEWRRLRLPALSASVALLAAFFGLVVPLLSYVSSHLQITFDAEWPRVPLFVMAVSPWAPLLLAGLGISALLAKERFVSTSAAARINFTAMIVIALCGILLCAILWLPIFQLMRALPD